MVGRYPLVVAVLVRAALGGLVLSTGAGAQLVNTDFEDGFTDGVAHGWVKFNEGQGSTTTASADATLVRNGGWSQRIVVRQPTANNAYGGIYQTFDTVPGTTYRFSVAAWRTFDAPEAWLCEHWVLWLGLDRTGGTVFRREGVDYYQFPCPRNSWQSQHFEFTASGTRATVFLVGERKYPIGFQQTVAANFDAGVFEITGVPGPTSTPTNTPTASPTPPPTSGPDTIANGGFEAGHDVNGVGVGWEAWTTTPQNAFWRDCAKLGPLGCGMYGACNDPPNALVRQAGKTILVMDGCLDQIDDIRARLPDAFIVGRPFDGDQGAWLQSDPAYWGRWFAETKCHNTGQKPNAWIGLNEPGVNAGTLGNAERVAIFELAFTRRLHELGHRSCVLNLANGTPDQLAMLAVFKDLLAEADYLGYHTGGPVWGGLIRENIPVSLRCRDYKQYLDAHGWRMPPVVYTENAVGDWQNHWTGQTVLEDHIAWAEIFTQDPWALGTCQFLTLSWGPEHWAGFSTSQCGAECDVLTEGLGGYNRAHPVDARSGTRAQTCGNTTGGAFRGGVRQTVSVTPGRTHLLRAWIKHEWYGGPRPAVRIRYGIDSTGQTANPDAPSLAWSGNLVTGGGWESDIWYAVQATVTPGGTTASLWFEGYNPEAATAFRLLVDDVSLHPAGEVRPSMMEVR